jgi:hypothetical protein
LGAKGDIQKRIAFGQPSRQAPVATTPSGEGAEELLAPTAAVKEPWQMTYDELRIAVSPNTIEDLGKSRDVLSKVFPEQLESVEDPWGIRRAVERGDEIPRMPLTDLTERHRGLIQQALSEGRRVPAEVLEDYPGLASTPKWVVDPIDKLIGKLKGEAGCNDVTISREDAASIVDLLCDYKSLKKSSAEEHYMLLTYLNREEEACRVLRDSSGSTKDLRKEALKVLGYPDKPRRKHPIQDVLLLKYYADLISGVNLFTGEKQKPLKKKEAVAKIAAESGQTEQAIKKRLQRTSTRLRKAKQLPKELIGILPPNWPIAPSRMRT